MADYYQHHIMWYTVYDAKTGDLIASGTSEMCARRLGYKSRTGRLSLERRWTACLLRSAEGGKRKSPPALPVPAGRRERLMVEPHHHKNTTICGNPQGGKM